MRRLFDEHLGASPIAIAQTRRVHFARKLIEESDLSMVELAHCAGVPVDVLIGQLEEEGVAAFRKSFESLLATLEEKRARVAG